MSPSATGESISSPARLQKILIFAGAPPPIHGQNVMVAALVEGLRKDPQFHVVHIDPKLSQRTDEIGQGSLIKVFRLIFACAHALLTRLREGPMIFYYVPAPGRRVPVFRDWIVLFLCRRFFPVLVLHWHAVGLGQWVEKQPSTVTAFLTRRALDQADLAIVLASELASDAEIFRPLKTVVIANGIPDPVPADLSRKLTVKTHHDVLFLGLGNEAKGLFVSLEAVRFANTLGSNRFRFTFAGNFATPEDEQRFAQIMQSSAGWLRRVGIVSGLAKATLLRESDVLCFPTQYAFEGQPLVLIEAMAFELPIVTTRWRAIPGMLPDQNVWFVEPQKPESIAHALIEACQQPAHSGTMRRHFLENFTLERHLTLMSSALNSLDLGESPTARKKRDYRSLRS